MFFFRALLFLSLNFSITFAELKEVDKSPNLNSTNNAEANKDLVDDQPQMEPGLTTNEDYSAVVDTLVKEENIESLATQTQSIQNYGLTKYRLVTHKKIWMKVFWGYTMEKI